MRSLKLLSLIKTSNANGVCKFAMSPYKMAVNRVQYFSQEVRPGERSHQHFKATTTPHPLGIKSASSGSAYENDDYVQGDHTGRQQNHIWSKDEIQERLETLYRHKPVSITDKIVNSVMYGCYHTFNFVTRYKPIDPPVKSIEWRLIILESIAGVPGFVAAGIRHFRSLRTLNRDHGWIATLLEEAENERMHLLVCLKMFKTTPITRALVMSAQLVMTPLLLLTYIVKPKAMHRFVGYLEETACHTYASVIQQIETPGTQLNKEWSQLPAPAIARGYWKLPEDALWVDTLKCMFADEANHRDVNHTFADMKDCDPNPFIEQHKHNAGIAWRLNKDAVEEDKVYKKN